jgi:predicted MFS family arabinose efflux permease
LNALVVPFVDEVLHAEAVVFGWLITAQGIGGLIGGFFVGWLGRAVPASHLLGFGLSIVGALTLVLVNLPSIPVALLVGALIGPPMMAAMVSQQTLLQTSVPDAYRGRILAAAGTTQSLLRLAGLGLSATLADALGIVPLMNLRRTHRPGTATRRPPTRIECRRPGPRHASRPHEIRIEGVPPCDLAF